MPRAGEGGLGRTYDDFCPIFGIPSWLMPVRDRSVRGGSPRASRTWSQRPKFVHGSLEPVPTSGAHTALTLKRGRSLGASNEVWFHRFSSPPFGSPFIPSPSHTFVSSFLSCPPVFMSVHLIPFFVCVHIGPGLSVHAHFYIGLYNEVGFIWCPCALGSPFISTTRTFVPSRPPVMSSFFCLARAHVHIGPHLSFTPPLGEACVCV